jgi:putative ABC transport system permease protein
LIVTTLAIGIAASTVVFSVADAILWHPLPFREPERLVALWGHDPTQKSASPSVPLAALNAWHAGRRSLRMSMRTG